MKINLTRAIGGHEIGATIETTELNAKLLIDNGVAVTSDDAEDDHDDSPRPVEQTRRSAKGGGSPRPVPPPTAG